MPDCRDCEWIDGDKCSLHKPWARAYRAPTRACVEASIRRILPRIKRGDEILEIGYGVWRAPEKLVRRQGATWYGVDATHGEWPERHHYAGTVTSIPFEEERFDGCLALETMEHWREHGDTEQQGLASIHKHLKPGGWLLITVPIHLHGYVKYIAGDVDWIVGNFDPVLWNVEEVEHWREHSEPVEPWYGWRQKHAHLVPEGAATWKLSITATRRCAATEHGAFPKSQHRRARVNQSVLEAIKRVVPAGGSIIDLGAGPGHYVRALRDAGYLASGVDGTWGIEDLSGGSVHQMDLAGDVGNLSNLADWALCLEVGEHVPPEHERRFIDNVCAVPREGLLVSWSPYHKRGYRHVNARTLAYVAAEFSRRGFRVDDEAMMALRSVLDRYYLDRLIVLRRFR